MGRFIHINNGQKTIYTTGEDLTSIPPEAGTYFLGINPSSGYFEKLDPNGNLINFDVSGGMTGGTYNSVTYSYLTTLITGSSLQSGSFYLINDFQTCYDQPDFDYNNNAIIGSNYKQGPVEPILVLATSANTISEIAYQPAYPKDRILYDWTFSTTEATNGPAFGRITERIDEFNNRTDYDHRNILFKRYRLYTSRDGQPLNGTIEMLSGGNVVGVGTTFTGLTVGDVIYVPSLDPGHYEIISITDDLNMTVSGDTISLGGPGLEFFKTIEETNGTGYFSHKQMNVRSYDYIEYTTFGDAISNSYVKNNYIGDYANNYPNVGSGVFLLANNVFLEGQYESNKFGDYCYNNTFGTDNQNNIWGDFCYENVSTNDIDDNIIGNNFYRNLLNVNLVNNQIGNYFHSNALLAENNDSFENNIIGNEFRYNLIYSWFYKNEILDDFNNNIIGDFGNLTDFQFYRNYIRNNFNNNTIRATFQNKQIVTNYQNNTINGEFVGNTILNGFNNNQIGYYFNVNNIGNGFNNNIVNDNFWYNTTGYYFNTNRISNNFSQNNLGNYFGNNLPSNINLFSWYDLTTVSTRTYDTFANACQGNLNINVGKELVMRVISTSQYFKIKFTQWSLNSDGFQYERQEIDSSGNTLSGNILFTKSNGGSEIDVIIPGVLEINRTSSQGIYNTITEGSWNGSTPGDTEWNSIYTQSNNGERFAYNKIGNNFYNNVIGSDFGFGGYQPQGNVINDNFENNTIGQFMYNNQIMNYFQNNTIGDYFENNTIKNYFIGNTIGDSFDSNDIGDYFGQNGGSNQNLIANDFKFNKIGNFFGNDVNGYGTGIDGGNIVNSGFQYNVLGDNVIFNAFDTDFKRNNIGNEFAFNIFSPTTQYNTIGNYFFGNGFNVSPIGTDFNNNKIGNFFGFNTIGNAFRNNVIGNYFGNAGNSNTIGNNFELNQIGNYFGDDGSATAGENTIANGFVTNKIKDYFINNNISTNFYGNDIGTDFSNNTVDSNFSYNNIKSSFNANTIGSYFNWNNVDTTINSTNFTTYMSGGVVTYTTSLGQNGVDGLYVGVTGTTNALGVNAAFDISVGGSVVTGLTINSPGSGYVIGDSISIDGASFGGMSGVDNINLSISEVTNPSVYQPYTCYIFERQGGNKRLSYYDSNDILTITDIDI